MGTSRTPRRPDVSTVELVGGPKALELLSAPHGQRLTTSLQRKTLET